ncbi:MAG: tetratricopeptide repeat protein [Myxococcaceae bacterium]
MQKAELECDLGLEFSPQYSDLLVNKGLIRYKQGRFDESKKLLIDALRINNEQAQAYNNLGAIYLYQEKQYGRAHDNFQRALKVDPDYLEARYNLSLALIELKKYVPARKELQTIIQINPSLADPYYRLAQLAYEDGKRDEAAQNYAKAVELHRDFPEAWLALGIVLEESGKFAEARDAFANCLAVDSERAECREGVIRTTRRAQLLDPVLNSIKDSRGAEKSPASLYELAVTLRDKGLRDEEEKTLYQCVKVDVTYPACHFALFQLFRGEERTEEASRACKNFAKYATSDEYPKEIELCEKYLNATGP